MSTKEQETDSPNIPGAVLCRLRDVAWLQDRLHILQEIVVRKDGMASLFRSPEFYGPAGEMQRDVEVPLSLFQQLEAEVEAGNRFSLMDGVPTFVEGLADSRALLNISPVINRLRALVDRLVSVLPNLGNGSIDTTEIPIVG